MEVEVVFLPAKYWKNREPQTMPVVGELGGDYRPPPCCSSTQPIETSISRDGRSPSGARCHQTLAGELRAGQTLPIDVPETFIDAEGGVMTLLDTSDLKVAAATYPAAADALPGWHKVG